MPKCKYCGARLSKFDTDICPVCGEKNPLSGVSSETIEITANLDINSAEFNNYKPVSKVKTFLFSALIGWSGAPFFYMKHKQLGMFWAVFNILFIIGGVGSILAFCTNLPIYLGYVIALVISYFLNLFLGIFVLLKKDLKDGDGEFLR